MGWRRHFALSFNGSMADEEWLQVLSFSLSVCLRLLFLLLLLSSSLFFFFSPFSLLFSFKKTVEINISNPNSQQEESGPNKTSTKEAQSDETLTDDNRHPIGVNQTTRTALT